ncbi:MAG: hypothetical protein OXC60_10770 [Litoreibacter sp.]|nr:hypothetical protein [Litoreibacter sp.]
MQKSILIILTTGMVLASCGRVAESRLNPFNWFGQSERETVVADAPIAQERRPLMTDIVSLNVERTPSGAIIKAVGLPPTQGFWDAELVRVETEDPSIALYDFRVTPPLRRSAVSTQASREVIVATSLNNIALQTIRQIVVRGQNVQRVVRR